MIIIDPIEFLKSSPPEESLLLRFCHWSDSSSVELVYDYAAEQVSAHFKHKLLGAPPPEPFRDFRKLVFSGAASVKCLRRPWPMFGLVSMSKSTDSGSYIISEIAFKRDGTGFKASIRIEQFGPYEFHFFEVRMLRRRGAGVERKDGNGWQYFDKDTGAEFDFCEPFSAGPI